MEQRDKIMHKQSIRAKYLDSRNRLQKEERLQKSMKIANYLKSVEEFQQAENILVYMDYRSEVMTTQLVEELLGMQNKHVYAPVVDGFDIRFFEITSLKDLKPGYQEIREPYIDPEAEFTEKTALRKSFVLVPGAVYDEELGRIGYGKGFYDRFLSKYPSLIKAGLAFVCQIAPMVPMEAGDVRVNMLITENGIIR